MTVRRMEERPSISELRDQALVYGCEIVTKQFLADAIKTRAELNVLQQENFRLRRRLSERPYFWWLRRGAQ